MTVVRKVAHFDVPLEQVFDLGIDFKRYPEWNVNYHEAPEILGAGPIGIGTKIRTTMYVLGRKSEGTAEVLEFDPPKLLKTKGTSIDGGTMTLTYRLTPVGTGCDLEVVAEYEPTVGILGQIADRLFIERTVERDIEHSLANFKALVETKVPLLV
jgi:uncharacterized membrane protein